jgi:hypothetical protein
MPALLALPDETLALVVLHCCDVTHVLSTSVTHSTFTLQGPSCLIMCTNKRLRDCGKKDPAWGEHLDNKRVVFLHSLCWERIRFYKRAWGSLQRAAVLGLSAAATQEHVLQKGGQSLKITAEFVRRKGNKCHIALDLYMCHPATTGLSAVKGNMYVDLPNAYATRPENRTNNQHHQMLAWERDRSEDLDNEFASLHKHFLQVGRPIFAYW